MLRWMFKSKIHMACVTQTELDYTGSITIPADLIKKADILPGERVQITVRETGARLETYVIEGPAGSQDICMNGPAARLVCKGDIVVIISYGHMNDEEAKDFTPTVLIMNKDNTIKEIL